MKLYQKYFASLLITLPILLAAANPCYMINLSGTTYTFPTSLNCTARWRATNYTSEDYTFCWVFSDGSYVRTNGFNNLSPGSPNTSIGQSLYPTGEKLMHTTVSNRYGDDNDTKRVIGGPVPPGNPAPNFTKFPASQSIMAAPALTKIQTDHSNMEVAKDQELMLILTVNGDHIENNDSLEFILPENNYVLRLYHKNTAVTYGFIPGETTAYPSDSGKYFAFAPVNNSSFSYLNVNYLPVKNWSIQNNFQGNEKNVYCLLKVPDIATATDEHRVLDTFVAVLTKPTSPTNNTPVFVTGSESKIGVAIGKSHDPNVIVVNIPTSTQCGPDANGVQEELAYTIHFQNTGSADENAVEVNLDLDPNLDNSSLIVTEIGIGTQSVGITNNLQQQSQYAAIGDFEYSVGSSNASYTGSRTGNVTTDARFRFSHITLKGINALDVEDTKGYIKFKIKTAGAYQTIHNQAGIFFGNNPEIVTNLAETKCMNDSMPCDSCRMHLKECRDKLKDFKENGDNSFMNLFGWIIAGLELLIIIYLLTRKRN